MQSRLTPAEFILILAPACMRDDDGPPDLPEETVRQPTTTHRRVGQLVLCVVDGPDRGKRHLLEVNRGRVLKAGRSITNDLVISDQAVSGTHFELIVQDDGIRVRDLDSANGVYLHNMRVWEAQFDLDAILRVGCTSLQLVGSTTINAPLSDHDQFGELRGDSPIMREMFADLERIARLAERLPVLVTGETGTGKELVARGLHAASARAAGPFVVLDCTALPRELAESHILGHARGAFTGAVRDHAGLFEQAHRGTLFIDELGELPLDLQAKLLRPLERGELVRLGESTVRKVDVRVISATHRDLRVMMSQGKFREDLYFRLAYKIVEVPALRERGDDILRLAGRFFAAACAREGVVPSRELSAAACVALKQHSWPGNVRQLKAVVECAALTTVRPVVEASDLRLDDYPHIPSTTVDLNASLAMPIGRAKEAFERMYYRALLRRIGSGRGWPGRGARFAGLDRTGFIKALRRLGLYPEQFPDPVDE